MKEIKINVSPKVWIYLLLVMIAVFAVIMGVSAAIGGPGAIGDVQLRVNAPEPWVVQLSGVDSFYVGKYKGRKFIGIRYKDNVEAGITDEEIAKDRKQRFKAALQGYPYEVYVGFLSLKPQEICNLLNARIKKER